MWLPCTLSKVSLHFQHLPVTSSSFLLSKPTNHTPNSGPLHLLPQVFTWLSPLFCSCLCFKFTVPARPLIATSYTIVPITIRPPYLALFFLKHLSLPEYCLCICLFLGCPLALECPSPKGGNLPVSSHHRFPRNVGLPQLLHGWMSERMSKPGMQFIGDGQCEGSGPSGWSRSVQGPVRPYFILGLESNSPYRVLDSRPEGPQGGSPLLYLSDYSFLFLWRVP